MKRHTLLILSKRVDEYRALVEQADLPQLQEIVFAPSDACDVVLGDPHLVAPVLTQLPGLKWVQSTWAGVEPFLAPGLRRDYLLTNARGVFGELMSEFVVAYLLLFERKVLQRLSAQARHAWDDTLTGTLQNKTIGLLGVGSIGAALARTAKFFGMKVRGYTRASEACDRVDQYFHPGELHAFAQELDYLVNVLPNTAETLRIVDAGLLAALPSRAIFINVGRGTAIDETALLASLRNGKLAGAVLDVFEREPLSPENPLWDAPNTFITSHTSAPSFPAQIARVFVDNYRLFAAGKTPQYSVDFARGY